jgi:metal-responsive CopG/Arc/MetJ family transcriptional regulator
VSGKRAYTEKFALKLPNEVLEAIQRAADARYTSRSEFIRQAILKELEREKERERQKIAA